MAPFEIEKQLFLSKLKGEIEKRKTSLQNGIVYPNGFQNKKVWDEIKRLKNVFNEEYNLILF